MHNPAAQAEAVKSGLPHDQQIRAYSDDFMSLDDNLFGLDSEGRDLVFGRNGSVNDSAVSNHHHQHYDTSAMQTDNADINNILAQMPTPISNNMRANPDGSSFMSPLQVDQQGPYERMNGVAYAHQEGQEIFFTPLLSPAVTPMDVLRHHDNVDPVYFSPLSSPALERFPQGTGAADARRSQSMVGLSTLPPNRRPDTIADGQRNPRRTAPYSPVARATLSRKRNSITSLNLTNGSPSEHSSDSVSPEPLPSSSMPPPPPRSSSSNKLYDKGASNGRPHKGSHRHKRQPPSNQDVSPATPSSFLNMSLQQQEDIRQQQGGQGHMESTVTFDHSLSSDTSPPTVKSAGSTPTFGPTVNGAMGSPSFISIPTSFDPNSSITSAALPPPANLRRPVKQSSRQARSSSSSPAFKPIISPNLKPLLPGGTSNEVMQTLASKSNYQNILEGNHSQLGLSYPKELSSGIESRRTSHKVAEQARRSRINNAIDQLGALLPGETDGISKAITVEKAIDYIKNLEDQLAKTKAELQETKK